MSAGNPIPLRKRSPWLKIAVWSVFYTVILGGFAYYMYTISKDVNTYGFVNGSIQVATSQAKYTVGDTISYTLTNNLASPITLVNNCPQEPLHVYKWENSQWQRIHDTAGSGACDSAQKQITIASGQAINGSFANWKNLFAQPGIYRVVAFASNYTQLPYADFQVVAPPAAAPQPTIIYQPVYTPVYTPVYINNNSGTSGGTRTTTPTNNTAPTNFGGDD
jgi:hypothetical protein